MREPPQQREQAIENRACACRIVEPAPGLGDSERAFHFVRASMGERVVAALVAATRALAFTQVERDAGRGGAQLGREIAIEALDGGQQGAELAEQLERDIVGNEHGVCFPNARRRVGVVVWARASRRARHAYWFALCGATRGCWFVRGPRVCFCSLGSAHWGLPERRARSGAFARRRGARTRRDSERTSSARSIGARSPRELAR